MQLEFRKTIALCGVITILLLFLGVPPALAMGAAPQVGFDLTGTILDSEGGVPIEGAFVMAVYKELQTAGSGPVTSWCVKTKGTYTGKDGKYRFPIEKLDGYSPFETLAIKPGYLYVRTVFPKGVAWRRQDKEAYSGRDIYFTKQKPGVQDYNFSGSTEHCTHARSRGDAEAAITFLQIKLSEVTRLGGPLSDQVSDAISNTLKYLQSLPDDERAEGIPTKKPGAQPGFFQPIPKSLST